MSEAPRQGPAMNAWIAEHVFGADVRWTEYGVAHVFFGECTEKSVNPADHDGPWCWDHVPRYSTNGNAMLELLEKMRNRDWDLVIDSDLINAGLWRCSFKPPSNPVECEVWHDSLPYAVCLAVWGAMEGEA